MAVPIPLRNLILRLISFSVLGPQGLRVDRRLALHDYSEFISDEIRLSKTYYELVNLVKVWFLVKPREVVDIGANIGNHSNFFEIKGCKVSAFEPVEANYRLLTRNLQSGQHFKFALGSEGSTGEFVIDSSSMGDSHLKGSIVLGDESTFATQTVDIRTLDSFELDGADLIKIDVEGHELEVLKGAQETIERLSPFIWLELHSQERLRKLGTKYTRGELLDWLSQIGYEPIHSLDSSNYLFAPKTLKNRKGFLHRGFSEKRFA